VNHVFHFFLCFYPQVVIHHGLECLKFNPVWQHYLKVHHLTCHV
jgi:hypothetical protein